MKVYLVQGHVQGDHKATRLVAVLRDLGEARILVDILEQAQRKICLEDFFVDGFPLLDRAIDYADYKEEYWQHVAPLLLAKQILDSPEGTSPQARALARMVLGIEDEEEVIAE